MDSSQRLLKEAGLARAFGRLRLVLGVATLAMLCLSWPLWVEGEPSAFPHVPFARGLFEPSATVSWIVFGVLLGSIAMAIAGIAWRRALGLSLLVLILLVLLDQQRFQAWVYQFGMVALLLASQPAASALTTVRGWYVTTYAYSGFSKLDASFCHELGLQFLETACRPFGLDSAAWPVVWRNMAILSMPVSELLLALGLGVSATRGLGRIGAVVLHLALIMLLGPWGMGHSTIVLAWNAAMLLEVWIAFGPGLVSEEACSPWQRCSWLGWLGRGAFLIGVLLPLGERSGLCDAWPGHALYASHVERTEVFLHEEDLDSYPSLMRQHVHDDGLGPWRRLDLTGWSRAVRGVPVYPEARACNGLAEAVAARYGDNRLIRVIEWSRAEQWTGRRREVALLGLEGIRRHGDQYRLNAHPARGHGW